MLKHKEPQLLKEFKKIPQDKTVKVGPGDDCAVIDRGDKFLLFCGDMLIEDVHFRIREVKFKDLGYKALARVLSDVASMGGYPKYAGLSLALPPKYSSKIKEILKGVEEIAKEFNFNLVGGDLSRAKTIFLDAWCIGYVEKNNLSLRSEAKDKDGIFVTGALGLGYRENFKFSPKIKEARWLVKNCQINSMIDISDGLVLDLYRILSESKKQAVLWEEFIPLTENVSLKKALYQGEDYQLLFTAPLKEKEKIVSRGFYFIGEVKKGRKPRIFLKRRDKKFLPLELKGYFSI
ncbi:MAG: thiamine-phosphate kinase [Candidatus Omnitrophica bacterium]|nr:thiamine-phosphate kinase [Candidatus Omnitrophota bacterium]